MTIADRLEALSAAIDEEAERAGADRTGGGVLALAGAAGGVGAAAAGGGGGAIQPRAESLATVLTQVWVDRCSTAFFVFQTCIIVSSFGMAHHMSNIYILIIRWKYI